MEELKNCPFCGSDRVEAFEKLSRGREGRDKFSVYIKCHKCRARGPAFGGTGKKNKSWRQFAVYEWNKAPRLAPAEV